jgi:hypothetical protein
MRFVFCFRIGLSLRNPQVDGKHADLKTIDENFLEQAGAVDPESTLKTAVLIVVFGVSQDLHS